MILFLRCSSRLGLWLLVLAAGCSGGEVDIGNNLRAGVDVRRATLIGNVCVPDDEFIADFPGYQPNETLLQTGTAACSSGLCLVHGFQGRVSCPYGQTEQDLDLPPDDPRRCRIPRSPSASEVVPVDVPVAPNFADRPAHSAAYCTCHCGGSDPDCWCPTGYSCRSMFEDIGLPTPDPVCVKDEAPQGTPSVPCTPGAAPGEPGYCGYHSYNP